MTGLETGPESPESPITGFFVCVIMVKLLEAQEGQLVRNSGKGRYILTTWKYHLSKRISDTDQVQLQRLSTQQERECAD